ncbi:MAG: 3'-5' exonuclease [Dehalococcoidia bacterium]
MLYVDKNVGDVIADVAREHNVRYVRIDGNAPYPKTPLTRWVEDCARWCSGEWRTGNQRIRDILELWGQLTGVDDEADIAADTKANLTQFLWNHRSADLPALDWLNALWRVALEAHLDKDGVRPDEFEVWERLIGSYSPAGALAGSTVQQFASQSGDPSQLRLITMHSCKGLEFDAVIMVGMDQGLIPRWSARTPAVRREQRRLFYVGFTRAMHEVHMFYSGFTTDRWGNTRFDGPSEFLLELRDSLNL